MVQRHEEFGGRDRGLMEARDRQRTVRAQRLADAAAVDRAEFQRVLVEARRQDAETRRLVRSDGIVCDGGRVHRWAVCAASL